MKLTKKLNEEILKVYNTYWESYSTGDVKTFAGTLDKTFEMIGTSETEICHTKEEGIKFLKAQVKELVGKVEMRNRKIRVAPVNELALVNEQCDIYILSGKAWSFYSKIRISTFLRNTYTGWKVFQQHGSLPDMQVQEGETLAFKKISKENLQLREAVKRRTVEIVHKNRELEIEASLERVRTVAMSMKKPEDMLRVCKTISQQLQKLGVKEIRNVQTAIFYEAKGTYMNYEFYAKHNKTFITDTLYTNHRIAKAFAAKMMKGKGQFYVTHLKGQKVKDWIAYQKTTNVFIDKFLNTATSLNYYWHSLGPVALGISTYVPLTQDEKKLFSRFLKVFDLAYRRYLDIEKAAAQAKEAEIELALERVRARTMAMQKSDELSETSFLLFQQLKELGETAAQISIGIVKEEEGFVELSATVHGDPLLKTYHVSIEEPYMMKKAVKAWKEKKKTAVVEINGKELIKYNNWRNRFLKKKIVFPESRWLVHLAFFSKGMLSFSSEKELSKESFQLLERFSSVFEQTYTRFLDLQKAEAQTKEAQIEGALEKVRSSSLAMHRSDEMQAVVNTVIDQLQKLNIVLDTTNILIFNNQEKFIEFWTGSNSTGAQLTASWRVPYFNISYYKAIHQAHVNGKEIFTGSYSFKEKNILFKHLFANTDFKNLNAERKKFILKSPRATIVAAIAKDTAIQVISYTRESFSEDEIEILKRFSKVFNQAYTRFLDLQKAEAQAREAQIQLALERVRARSLAMHHTSELQDVVNILAQQLHNMGMDINGGVFIAINDEVDENFPLWASSGAADYIQKAVVPFFDKPIYTHLRDAIKKRNNFFEETYSKKEKDEMFKHLFRYAPWNSQPEKRKKELLSREGGLTRLAAISRHTCIAVTNHNGKMFLEEEKEILKRFGNVFEQTYIRFLDLQKAEAQVREAQIEAALERVRSRSMAMHASKELKEVAKEMRNQFSLLGLKELETCAIHLWDQSSHHLEAWAALRNPDNTGEIIESEISLSIKGIRILEESFQKYLAGKKDYVVISDADRAKEFFEAIKKVDPKTYNFLSNRTKNIKPNDITAYWSVSDFHGGSLVMVTVNAPDENSRALLRRFANVFGQAYQRFKDLQKAEAQTKEAQIQLALERVRARSLAMHHTSELQDVVNILAQQLHNMGMDINGGVFIAINDEVGENLPLWASSGAADYIQKAVVPFFDKPIYTHLRDAIKKRNNFFEETYSKKEKDEMFKHLFRYAPWNSQPEKRKKELLSREGGLTRLAAISRHTCIAITNHNGKMFLEEEKEILKRFGNVFEQTYIRFLDLQKAEAQVREAQIEAALERVRSRSLAMHKSDELKDVIRLVLEQFVHLKVNAEHAGFYIDYKVHDDMHIWLADPNIEPFFAIIPYFDTPTWNSFLNAKAKGTPLHTDLLDFKEKNNFYQSLFKLFEIPEEAKKFYMECKGLAVSTVLLDTIGLYIENFSAIPYTDEENEILFRFGKVFQQTYTRFLDLQKAEAQARESQIQLSLERIRARSMSMQQSDELSDVLSVLFEQFDLLGIKPIYAHLSLINLEDNTFSFRMTGTSGQRIIVEQVINVYERPEWQEALETWKNNEPGVVSCIDYPVEVLPQVWEVFSEIFKALPPESMIYPDQFPDGLFTTQGHCRFGYIGFNHKRRATDEEKDIVARIATEFGRVYQRFLDLQKAEAQARESQIQLALERVRARTMAMQKSDELPETSHLLFQQMRELGEPVEQLTIGVVHEENNVMEISATLHGGMLKKIYLHSIDEPFMMSKVYRAWKTHQKTLVVELKGDELNAYNKYRNELTKSEMFPTDLGDEHRRIVYAAFFSKGMLALAANEPRPSQSLELLERFASVFDLTYTRFLDLQKAEAQARESQIQLALERVRARTMAMQKSDELSEAVFILFNQFKELGEKPDQATIGIINEKEWVIEYWVTM